MDIPLRYGLYLGADGDHLARIDQVKDQIVGIKVYMGSSTGGLIMDNTSAFERVFQVAATMQACCNVPFDRDTSGLLRGVRAR